MSRRDRYVARSKCLPPVLAYLLSATAVVLPVPAEASLPQGVEGAQIAPVTPADWRADLRYLASELIRRHPDPFHTVSAGRFESAVAGLDGKIDALPPHRIIVDMAQIVALIGDAHTYVDLPEEGPLGFSRLPIRLTLFSDGLYVSAATEEQRRLIGSRVERIGGQSVDQVLDRVASAVSRDNEMTLRFLVPRRLAFPEVLHAVGVVDRLERIPLALRSRDGKPIAVELAPLDPGDKVVWVDGVANFGAVDVLYWADPETNYWIRHLPERAALYLQFNSVRDKEDEPLAEFARRLGRLIGENSIERLIIDVRRNIGGNSRLTYPLIREIIKSGRFEEPGSLFTLIGPASISATVVFAVELDRFSGNIFIGEPSGSRPNQYGENRFFRLPNSQLAVSYSSAYFQTAGPFDESEWIAPQVAVSMSSDDYFAGRDPALAAALEYDAPEPIDLLIGEAVRTAGLDSALAAYGEFIANPRNRYLDSERAIRNLAGQLLEEGMTEEALAFYRANIETYPERSRAHLGLAIAYKTLGRQELARAEFQRGLSLLPTDRSLYNAQRHALEEYVRGELAEIAEASDPTDR